MRLRLRVVILAVLFVVLVVIAHDSVTPPAQQFLTAPAVGVIQSYRAHVSPHLTGIVRCRFTPTCSLYGLESVRKYGALKGGLRALWRVARCNPLMTRQGTVDPP